MRIEEAFNYRKYQEGEVQFQRSSMSDPFCQQVSQQIAQAKGVPYADVLAFIQSEQNKLNEQANQAPLLAGTIAQNSVESTLFKLLCVTDIPTNAPKFSNVVFQKLMRQIRAENNEFFPLRGFIKKRPLHNIVIEFVDNPVDFFDTSSKSNAVNTAAALPSGRFIFNVPFMQKLMDYSNLKQLKPQGRKYVSNGGSIPDEYGYIEFLIMHELMHYSNEDFYYNKVIPKADNTIINYVGDFRTNYLLVKSGYTQIPIGLFADGINYDRQATYKEMYDLVKAEMEKLGGEGQKKMKGTLSGSSDDHEPGHAEASEDEEADEGSEGATTDDIDEHNKKIRRQMQQAANDDERGKSSDKPGNQPGKGDRPGTGKNGNFDVDYTKIRPKFNWKGLIKKFIASVPKMEQTYTRPHRRSVSGMEIVRQTGAGAIKPGDRPESFIDAKLTFVFDSSGSMSGVIETVYANAATILSQPAFKRSEVFIVKFSGDVELYRCHPASGKAVTVPGVSAKAPAWNTTIKAILQKHYGGGTVFGQSVVTPIQQLLRERHNVIICTDGDILWGENLANLAALVKQAPKQVFVILDKRETYLQFRQKSGIVTENITYFLD